MRKSIRSSNAMSRQSGYTFIQVMTAIAIVAVLGVVAAKEVIDQMEDNKPDALADQISRVSAAMVKCGQLYRGTYENCDYDQLVTLEYLDASKWGDGTGVNVYDGDITAGPVADNSNQFEIGATSISSDGHCARLEVMYQDDARSVSCSSGTLALVQGSI